MREQSKHKRTTEMKSRETIEYKGLGGGLKVVLHPLLVP